MKRKKQERRQKRRLMKRKHSRPWSTESNRNQPQSSIYSYPHPNWIWEKDLVWLSLMETIRTELSSHFKWWTLCYIVEYCSVLDHTVLYYIVHYHTVLYCIILYCFVLYHVALYHIVMYYIVLYFIVSYCIVFYLILQCCTVQ